ncbi:hypothetical protein D3C73_1565990 [compost metagenome]
MESDRVVRRFSFTVRADQDEQVAGLLQIVGLIIAHGRERCDKSVLFELFRKFLRQSLGIIRLGTE